MWSPIACLTPCVRFSSITSQSYEQLESLILLVQYPGEDWGSSAIASRLGIDEDSARAALTHLCARGLLLEERSRYRFAPTDSKLREEAIHLVTVYQQCRLSVISTMSSNALERVRLAGVRTFAEAFRLRGTKRHG
ncbi:MAG: hypothetical protein QM784_05990 [Polyangiaceae bacterium]